MTGKGPMLTIGPSSRGPSNVVRGKDMKRTWPEYHFEKLHRAWMTMPEQWKHVGKHEVRYVKTSRGDVPLIYLTAAEADAILKKIDERMKSK